jgi:hypothetical protein
MASGTSLERGRHHSRAIPKLYALLESNSCPLRELAAVGTGMN